MNSPVKIDDIIDDRYKITEFLGEGGMATVFKAYDIVLQKDVAFKIIREDTAKNSTNLNRFEREARAAASLNHQNIVRVLNVGSYKGFPYMINEFVNGQNVRQILDVRGRFTFMEALDVMYQLCSAVMYAHEHNIIHRDIKPQNIFITSNGTAKLGDFGIATFQNATNMTRSDVVVGSVHYIAPEIASGNQATVRSDVYSMGITFFELITGRVPFDSDSQIRVAMMQIKEKFPLITKYNPKTPPCIENIIYKAVNKDPKSRYQSAESMRKDIQKIMNDPSLLEKKSKRSIFSKEKLTKDEKRALKEQKKALKKSKKESKRI